MCTFDALLLLVLDDCVVKRWEDVEEQYEELYFRPILFSESSKGEVFIIYFECSPRPFHLSCLSFILVEIFKRFSFLGCHVIELREAI